MQQQTIAHFIIIKKKKKAHFINNKNKSLVLVAVKLNSYIAILAPPKHKNQLYNSGVKSFFFFFLPSLLQCMAIDGCAL